MLTKEQADAIRKAIDLLSEVYLDGQPLYDKTIDVLQSIIAGPEPTGVLTKDDVRPLTAARSCVFYDPDYGQNSPTIGELTDLINRARGA